MRKLVKNSLLVALFIGLFCLFAVNSSATMVHHMTSPDCPMQVNCQACVAPASADAPTEDFFLPAYHHIFLIFDKSESIPLDPIYHPPKY